MTITPDIYQQCAMRTANSDLTSRERLSNFGLGITGEAGEVADYLKKVIYHGHILNPDVIKKELGDVLWYVAVLAREVGLNLSDVMEANIEKLKRRYPDGFSSEASIQRAPD